KQRTEFVEEDKMNENLTNQEQAKAKQKHTYIRMKTIITNKKLRDKDFGKKKMKGKEDNNKNNIEKNTGKKFAL
nr:hypothetical protein [Tanacetum cinerariifolium]GEX65796.1 hypothetical protein [Tanacetum cinerariifolium]